MNFIPHFLLRRSFLVLFSLFHKPQLILCFSLADVIFTGLCYLPISALDFMPLFTTFCTCCLKFKSLTAVPVQHAGFSCLLPIILLIRIICVCIRRTLLTSDSKSAWLLFPKVPIFSILPAGFCQNWVQSTVPLTIYSAFWELKLSARLVKKVSVFYFQRNEGFYRHFETNIPNTKMCCCPDTFLVCTRKASFWL